MKIDFHVHTKYSHDAVVTLEDIEAILSRSDRVVDAMAITDHNTVEGSIGAISRTFLRLGSIGSILRP